MPCVYYDAVFVASAGASGSGNAATCEKSESHVSGRPGISILFRRRGHRNLYGMTNQETIQQITRGYRLPRPNSCPAEVYGVMLECWKSRPEDRPPFHSLRKMLFCIYKWGHYHFS